MKTAASSRQVVGEIERHHLKDGNPAPWYRRKNLRVLYLLLMPAALGVEMTSGYDGSALNGLQAVQPWTDYFDNPQGQWLGFITAAYSIGAVIGLPPVPWVNDRFGRRVCLLTGTCILMIGTLLQGFSQNMAMFVASRLILGMGVPFAVSGASQLISELAHPNDRSWMTAMFNSSWYLGSTLAAGITLGTFSMASNWDTTVGFLASHCVYTTDFIQFTFIWFIPESPRWLLSKDRGDDAFKILTKYHAEGDEQNVFVIAEYHQIKETLSIELENSKRSWKEMIATRADRHRSFVAAMVGLFQQWSGNGLINYYLAKVLATVGITSHQTQNIINVSIQVWSFLTAVLGAVLAHYLPRRTQFLIAFLGMFLVFVGWSTASGIFATSNNTNNVAGGAVLALMFLLILFYNFMMPLIYVYVIEIMPFSIRSKGNAITQGCSRAASAFNQFVNPIGMQNLGWKFYLVYVGWLAVETAIVYFFYPETKGLTLEEVALVFETPASIHEKALDVVVETELQIEHVDGKNVVG